MLYLLHFAYLESMGLWILPYSLAGVFLSALAARRVEGNLRLASITFVLALFFSLSLVVGRIAAPVPTLFAAGLWAVDTAKFALISSTCRPSPEGCIPPEGAEVVLVLPFLIQWALLYVLVLTAGLAWRVFRERRRPGAQGKSAR